MKLTVSSTAMMKPLLHADEHPTRLSPPQRVVGLLECDQLPSSDNSESEKLMQYSRPDQQHALLQTAQWYEFLQIENAKNVPCIAVFGFKFDGTTAWYQVWNDTNDQICWLIDKNNMNYEPFAILAMDALVSLLPNWNGRLYPSPEHPAHELSNPSFSVECHDSVTIDARKGLNVLISDASTSAAGQLWFLVTINSNPTKLNIRSKITNTQSGWIPTTLLN